MKKLAGSLLLFITAIFAIGATNPSISILGDSYSTFEGYVTPATNAVWYYEKGRPDNDVADVTQTWWQILAREHGYKIDTNNSYSGSTICRTGYRGADYTDRAFITRMDNLGSPDVILVFGATNDAWAGVPIGEYKYGDFSEADLYQFRPAMARMAEYLTKRYPNTDLRFVLNTDLKNEINESVDTICAHYGISVVKLVDIDKASGHPSVLGMRQIADQIANAIKKQP